MKLILVHPPSRADEGMFDAPLDDPGNAPWIRLRNELRKVGCEIDTTWRRMSSVDHADWVLFMNLPEALKPLRFSLRSFYQQLKKNFPQPSSDDIWARLVRSRQTGRAALFLWEPEVVLPVNYITELHSRFGRVFTWKKDLILQGGRYRPIVWPQPSGVLAPRDVQFDVRKLLVNFSGNKKSSLPLELYSAREEVIRFMEKNHPDDFDHYGFGWSKDYPSWRGSVESKFDIYPSYKFGLCYENMHSVEGYVTEKIFDCIRSGVVPIYWGAPDIADVVHREVFIDRRNFDSTRDLVRFLKNMDETRWSEARQAGKAYLESNQFKKFLPGAFCEQLLTRQSNSG